MKKGLILAGSLIMFSFSGLGVAAPTDVVAGNSGKTPSGNAYGLVNQNRTALPTQSGAIAATPEIDGAGALTAIAMLGGILALVGERRRRPDK